METTGITKFNELWKELTTGEKIGLETFLLLGAIYELATKLRDTNIRDKVLNCLDEILDNLENDKKST